MRVVAAAIVLSIVAACAGGRESLAPAPASTVPYQVRPHFDSEIDDRYFVLTGPAETYRTYRINERFQSALGDLAESLSGGSRVLDLTVTLTELSTAYDEIGEVEPTHLRFYGARAVPGAALPVSHGAHLASEDTDFSIPMEIIKSATLRLTAEVRRGGTTLGEQAIVAQATDTVYWQDYDSWAYHYDRVFEEVIGKALRKIEDLVRSAAAG